MRRRTSQIVCVLLVALSAPEARSQQRPTEPAPFSLEDIAASLRLGGPEWAGRATFAAGTRTLFRAGAHGRGDIILETEVAPNRTARLLETVWLTDPANGVLTIPAGSALIARNGFAVEAPPGGQPIVTDRGQLQWCVLGGAGAPICISLRTGETADYREVGASARSWRGSAPNLVEEPLLFDPPLTRQLLITDIDAQSVTLESSVGHGAQRVSERGFRIPFGVDVDDPTHFFGLRFRLRRGQDESVIVQQR